VAFKNLLELVLRFADLTPGTHEDQAQKRVEPNTIDEVGGELHKPT
jgi:hypothetical protein